MNIAIISPHLAITPYRERWAALASANPNIRIDIICKKQLIRRGYGKQGILKTASCDLSHNLKLIALSTILKENTRYILIGLLPLLISRNYDYIYCIHQETIPALCQVLILNLLVNLLLGRKTKVVFFSMSEFPICKESPEFSEKLLSHLRNIYVHMKWIISRKLSSGCICHTPTIKARLIADGYKKPILVQTQHGVSPFLMKDVINDMASYLDPLLSGKFVIGFCGRICKEKGFIQLISALKILQEQYPQIPFFFLSIGDGDPDFISHCTSLLSRFTSSFHITGYIPHSNVHHFMTKLDLLVVPSLSTASYIDTFPLVVPQAMSLEVPVIGSNTGGIPYQLQNKSLTFNACDPAKIVELIYRLYSNPYIRNDVRIHQSRLCKKFQHPALNSQLLSFLDSI